MKKIIYSILFVTVLLASACSLDKTPSGSIVTDEAIKSVADAQKVRNGLYLRLRGMNSSYYVYNSEISMDIFHASYSYGNRGGIVYRWEWTSQDADVTNLWASCYTTTALANFMIQSVNNINTEKFSEADKNTLALYKAEAHLVKAISAFALVQKYCEVYDPSTAASKLGIMLVEEYNPSSNQDSYPGRSSLAESYDYIKKHISEAENGLKSVKGAIGSVYLSTDAISAFKSRVALEMKDYATAITYSTQLVDSGNYPLIPILDEEGNMNKVAFNNLWTNDSGEECIIQLAAEYPNSVPSSCAYSYSNKNTAGKYVPDFITEDWVVDLYSNKDIRSNWFIDVTCDYGTVSGKAVLCNKFAGNPALQAPTATVSSHINKIKLYRIAEQYLIAAEAYAMNGDPILANKYLNDLRKARIIDYKEENFGGNDLINEIRKERVKELLAEGFRFNDIKRWGIGFTRGVPQNINITTATAADLSIDPQNYKFLWPIPQKEIDANPQIKDQQNPGY